MNKTKGKTGDYLKSVFSGLKLQMKPKEEVGRGNDMAASVKGWFAKTCKF